MPRLETIVNLRTDCLRQADMENDSSVTSGEVNRLLSRRYGDLYSVVAGAARRYFETSSSTTMSGLSYITEPTDMLATVDTIERQLDSSGRLVRLKQLMPQERAFWSGKTGHARRWELVDDKINLYPTPPSGDIYILRYIPQPPDLSSYTDNQTVDLVTPDGLDFVIWGVVVNLLAKGERDPQLAVSEREQARGRLLEWAQLRTFNDPPHTVVDVDDWYDAPFRDGEWYLDRF